MKQMILSILSLSLMVCLTGCGNTKRHSGCDMTGICYIAYTDIDTVCEDEELISAGNRLLLDQKGNLLLSYAVDSAVELTKDELGGYDHLVITNPQWIERFGDSNKLKPTAYGDLPKDLQVFLDQQMPLLTNDGSALPEDAGLYEYEGGGLLTFPVNVILGTASPVKAKNPLVLLIDDPTETLKTDSCMLPLTSSGNVLFSNGELLRQSFDNSRLRDYGDIQELEATCLSPKGKQANHKR